MKISVLQKGFTIVELVIVLTITITIGIIFSSYVLQSIKTIKFIDEFNVATEEAKKGITTMNAELRETRNSDASSYDIELATATEVVFFSNIDGDTQMERIRYFAENKKLKKGVINPVGLTYPSGNETITILSQYVENTVLQPIFTYYDINNTLLEPVTISSIRMIKTHLEINMTPEPVPRNYVLESNVHLRNLKVNY